MCEYSYILEYTPLYVKCRIEGRKIRIHVCEMMGVVIRTGIAALRMLWGLHFPAWLYDCVGRASSSSSSSAAAAAASLSTSPSVHQLVRMSACCEVYFVRCLHSDRAVFAFTVDATASINVDRPIKCDALSASHTPGSAGIRIFLPWCSDYIRLLTRKKELPNDINFGLRSGLYRVRYRVSKYKQLYPGESDWRIVLDGENQGRI